jgi:phenylacetate-CoA ligase
VHAKSSVPYYRDALADIAVRSLGDIATIPFLTKKDIQSNTELLKARGYPAERFIPNSTGGSTGEKLEIYSDTNTQQAAFIMRGNLWTGWKPGEKQLQLWGESHDLPKARGAYKKFVAKFVHRNRILSSYSMNEQNMLDYCRIINRHKPQLITGYTSALLLFSRFLLENKLKIYSPKGIIGSAETLRQDQREIIESAFRCKLLNRYGCREVGNIAQECGEQNGLHIHVEHLVVEVVDENGRHCMPGETGEIVLTALDNYAFPFIRYKVGDLGALCDRKCVCGRGLPMLESIEGRVWDIIVGANGNRLVGTFWLVEGVKGIREYQVIQEHFGHLTIRLVVDRAFSDVEKRLLLDRVKNRCGDEMKVEFQMLDSIPLTEGGKRRFIISHVSPYVQRQAR